MDMNLFAFLFEDSFLKFKGRSVSLCCWLWRPSWLLGINPLMTCLCSRTIKHQAVKEIHLRQKSICDVYSCCWPDGDPRCSRVTARNQSGEAQTVCSCNNTRSQPTAIRLMLGSLEVQEGRWHYRQILSVPVQFLSFYSFFLISVFLDLDSQRWGLRRVLSPARLTVQLLGFWAGWETVPEICINVFYRYRSERANLWGSETSLKALETIWNLLHEADFKLVSNPGCRVRFYSMSESSCSTEEASFIYKHCWSGVLSGFYIHSGHILLTEKWMNEWGHWHVRAAGDNQTSASWGFSHSNKKSQIYTVTL